MKPDLASPGWRFTSSAKKKPLATENSTAAYFRVQEVISHANTSPFYRQSCVRPMLPGCVQCFRELGGDFNTGVIICQDDFWRASLTATAPNRVRY